MSLVVVSNRVAKPRPGEPVTGGLAAALLPAVEKSGAIWVGSSGRVREKPQADPITEMVPLGRGMLATVDLPAKHYSGYYEGYANSCLWPAMHSRSDLIRVSEEDYTSYRAINAFMAHALKRFDKRDTTFWIQDYHFFTLAAEMRKLGMTQPIGFFLHTPWPMRSVMLGVPNHRDIVSAMLAYDLIGFQTQDDCDNFASYVREYLGLRVQNGRVATARGSVRLGVFPIGIDVEGFARQAIKSSTRPDVVRLKRSLHGAKLAIGVDRVDYSKGLANRIKAFDRLLTVKPSLKRNVSLLQIAIPSRTTIEAYGQLQADLARLVSEVNGRHGEIDWTPIRYLNKGFSQQTLASLYRAAQVGVVTPLHDGMNLVAKEYVAAQNPMDPGVLVLSEFAGAARELDAALLVNPHDIDGIQRAISRALEMPIEQRRERWDDMMEKLRGQTVHNWFADFTAALADAGIGDDDAGETAQELPRIVAGGVVLPMDRGSSRAH